MSTITTRFTSHLVQRAAQVLAIAVAVVTICCTASTHAQNYPVARDHFNGSAVDRILKSQPSPPTPLRSRYDNQVVQTRFDQTPPASSARNERRTSEDLRALSDPLTAPPTRQQNFIEREKEASSNVDATTAKPKGQKIGQVIASIGMNLAFVLLVGIGFIVFSKQWFTTKANNKTESSESGSSKLQVKEELALDSKTTIRVIQWKDSEILVASDSEGVRSMISLGPTFSDTLSQVETEFEAPEPERPIAPPAPPQKVAKPTPPPESNRGIDDRLIQMLLDSANRSASSASSSKGKA